MLACKNSRTLSDLSQPFAGYSPPMIIRLDEVSKYFGSFCALENFTLTVEPGQIVAVLGSNGAGKTTLLCALSGIVAPTQGSIFYDDQLFHRGRIDLRRRILFLPDHPALFARTSLLRHISMCVRLYDIPMPAEDRVVEILHRLDLLPVAAAPASTLSRGQLYKGALAALLLIDPELWILDEPLASGMDPGGIAYFKQQAREAAKRGRIVVYTTQLLEIAEKFSDRVCIIDHGRLQLFSRLAELGETSASQSLEQIFLRLRESAGPR